MDRQVRMEKENETLGTERYENIDTPFLMNWSNRPQQISPFLSLAAWLVNLYDVSAFPIS